MKNEIVFVIITEVLGMQGEGTIYASFIADVLLTAPCLYTKHLGQLESTEQN